MSKEKPLTKYEAEKQIAKLSNNWVIEEIPEFGVYELIGSFEFTGFPEAIAFINKVAGIAENEKHHPDICVFFNEVSLSLQTHSANGLTEKDFFLAEKIDKIR